MKNKVGLDEAPQSGNQKAGMRKTRTPITSWMRFAVAIQQTGKSRTQQMG
jgi:hypothetical protein